MEIYVFVFRGLLLFIYRLGFFVQLSLRDPKIGWMA